MGQALGKRVGGFSFDVNPNIFRPIRVKSSSQGASLEKDERRNIAPVQNQNISQALLIGITTVCAVLSIIPPLRFGAALALRGVALLSNFLTSSLDTFEGKAVKAAKIGAIIMGLVGLAATLPALLIASLGVDIAVQATGLIRHIHDGNYTQALVHFAILVIDVLALTSLILGSWQFMVASMAVTAAVMIGGAVSSFKSITLADDRATIARKIVSGIAFGVLAGASVAGAITISEIKDKRPDDQFTVKNKDPQGYVQVGNQRSEQGQDLLVHGSSSNMENLGGRWEVHVFQMSEQGLVTSDYRMNVPTHMVSIQNSLKPSLFGTLPVVGGANPLIAHNLWIENTEAEEAMRYEYEQWVKTHGVQHQAAIKSILERKERERQQRLVLFSKSFNIEEDPYCVWRACPEFCDYIKQKRCNQNPKL